MPLCSIKVSIFVWSVWGLAKRLRRWHIQLAATIASNPFLMNFFQGKIYKGELKGVCVPGLNCYSCPAAAASCPIGALQAVAGSSKFHVSYYVVGILILFGVLLGRVVCGFLCPFGWFQELLHKIPSKKYSTKRLYILTYLKYIVAVLVVALPVMIVNGVGLGDPQFCKYLCPVGVLEGGIPLSLADGSVRASLGNLFTWKTCLLVLVIVLAVLFYRPFCKWICPLGALYALFNKVSLYQIAVDENRCVACGSCSAVCKMDVDVFRTPNHTECIRCGACMQVCPHQAISQSFSVVKKQEGGNKI